MAITAAQVDIWRTSAGETPHLEFKEARNQYYTTKLRRYCVAIANEGGGYLVLGGGRQAAMRGTLRSFASRRFFSP